MANATNQQIQAFQDTRVRPRCEEIRALVNACIDDIAEIGDVFATLSGANTYTDTRTDGPPHLGTGADILAWNTFIHTVAALANDANYPIVQKLCVRPVNS